MKESDATKESASRAKGEFAAMEENGFRFEGAVRKIRLVSRLAHRSDSRPTGAEIAQYLTVASNGKVRLSRHFRSEAGDACASVRKRCFRIPRRDARAALRAVEDLLCRGGRLPPGEGAGAWLLTLADSAGHRFHVEGRLCPGDASGAALSDLLRVRLDRFELLAFDGSPDRVERVDVCYRRRSVIQPEPLPEEPEPRPVTWDYRECLILDREAGALELNREIGTECKMTLRYSVPEGIAEFLDALRPSALVQARDYPEDAIADPDDRRDYAILVRSAHGRESARRGAFDRDGLPPDWPGFIGDVYRFIAFYGLGEMFSRERYMRHARRRSDRRFCFVSFEEGGREYSYLADDVELEEGDLVVVPVDKEMRETVARVERVVYRPESEAPFPMDRIKRVLRKCEKRED